MDLEDYEIINLLRLSNSAIEELRRREVVTTSNAPLGGYAEWLFRKAFGWKDAGNSNKDVDAIGRDGTRYQIKSRRIHKRNKSRQLGALRRLDKENFDVLAAALFNEDFTVMRAALIPHRLVLNASDHVDETNSGKFLLRDSVWSWDGVQDVTEKLKRAQ
ncbi:hypothetical protein KFF05_00425 [bacterium SCSIO 12827]|nr:hypothetical protein KFF05_00425 [bacterium SCSIO 12827]